MKTIDELKLEGDPFLCEEYKKYWKGIEYRLKQNYGIPSLIDCLEEKLKQGISKAKIAKEFGIGYTELCIFTNYAGLKKILFKKQKPPIIRKVLTDLQDIVDLEIKPFDDLNPQQRNHWKPAEQRLKEKYGPRITLSSYIIYNYHFCCKSYRNLALEIGGTGQSVRNLMVGLGIPLKNSLEAGKTYEQIYGESKAREIRAKLRRHFKGKTFEQRYGKKRAKQVKAKLSQRLLNNIPWNKGLTKETDERVLHNCNIRKSLKI